MIVAVVASLAAFAMTWTFGPLANRLDATSLAIHAARLKDWPLAPVVIATMFFLACMVGAPGTAAIGTMVLLFGPLQGPAYAYATLLSSGTVIYLISRRLARVTVDDWLASRTDARWMTLNRRLAHRGLIAVALVRLTPLPFAIQNLLLGSSRVSYPDFLFGTMLGLMPIMLLMAVLATRFAAWLDTPDFLHLALLIAALLVVVTIVWSIGRRIAKRPSCG